MRQYYVMQGVAVGPVVILNSLRGPADGDGWMLVRNFKGQVQVPVQVTAKEDFDAGILMPLYPTPTIMRRDLYEAICSAGVDNIDVWQAIVRKADGTILSDQYLAFNVLGIVSAAGPGTTYAPENPSRLVDASIESLEIDESAAHGFLLFRLAESIDTVVVHRKVRAAIEARGIKNIAFVDPPDYLS
jgi:hypothetical protein